MLHNQTQIGALPVEALSLTDAHLDSARPEHVNPLLWKLASPAEREAMRQGEVPRHMPHLRAALREHNALTGHHHSLHLWGHGRFKELAHRAAEQAKKEATSGNEGASQGSETASNAPRLSWGKFGARLKKLHDKREAADNSALNEVKAKFEARFADAAKDPQKFHDMLRTAFGDTYDAAAAEKLRQQTLNGDFSWMPKVEIVNEKTLDDTSGTQGEGVGKGAYAKENDTIYINRDMLKDPAELERMFSEEMGHALDARLNKADAKGDEGDIFATVLHDGKIDSAQLAAMRADNDHGVIMVNGKAVEVEYKFGSRLKKAWKKCKKAVKKAVDTVVDTVKKAAEAIAETVRKVAEAVKETVKALVESTIAACKAAYLITAGALTGDMDKIMKGIDEAGKAVKKLLEAKMLLGPVGFLIDQVPALDKLYNKAVNFVVDIVKSVSTFVVNTIKAQIMVTLGVLTGDLDKIKAGLKQLNEAVKSLVMSKWLGFVMMIAQYIPIPILQAAVRVIQLVKAVYMLVQAIKNKSLAGILSAAAGAVGSLAAVAPALGVAANVVDGMKKAATGLRVAAQVYTAAAQRDFTAAAAALSEAVGAPKVVTQGLQIADKGVDVVNAARHGDVLGAIEQGAALAGSATRTLGGSEQAAKLLDGVAKDVHTGRAVAQAIKTGDFAGAALMLASQLELQGTIVLPKNIETVLSKAQQLQDVYQAVRKGDVEAALANGLNLVGPELCSKLNLPPDTAATVQQLLQKAEVGKAVFDAVKSGDYTTAANVLASQLDLSGMGVSVDDVRQVIAAAEQAHAVYQAARQGNVEGALLEGADLLDTALLQRLGTDPAASQALVDAAEGVRAGKELVEAIRSGDVDKLLAQTSPLVNQLIQENPEAVALLNEVADQVKTGETVLRAIQSGHYADAATLVADRTGLSDLIQQNLAGNPELQQVVASIQKGDHAGAAQTLATWAGVDLAQATEVVSQMADTIQDAKDAGRELVASADRIRQDQEQALRSLWANALQS